MTMDGDEEEGDDDDVAALVMPCPGCFATSLCLLEEISYEFVAEPGEVMSQCLEVLKNEVGCPGNSVLATDSAEQQQAARHDFSVAHRHVRSHSPTARHGRHRTAPCLWPTASQCRRGVIESRLIVKPP